MKDIILSKVSKNYGYEPVLNKIDVEIKTGERVALVGANGAGKSTLFKIMARLETADSGTVTIRKDAVLGYLEQIPVKTNTNMTVSEVLNAAFAHIHELGQQLAVLEEKMSTTMDEKQMTKIIHQYARLQEQFIHLNGYELTEKFDYIISLFQLKPLLDQPFNLLSGGQKTKTNLAATLLKEPDILLLDEPTNHLDIKALEWLENFLIRYTGTVVIISHDRYFLDKVATKTIILERGQAQSFNGNYSYALAEQERLLLIEFEQYKTQQKQIAAMKAAIKRFRQWGHEKDSEKMFRKAKVIEKRLAKLEQLEKPQLEKSKLELTFAGNRTGHDVLSVKNLTLLIGERLLLENANLSLYASEKVCLMGDNGSGKTTLIKSIMGQYEHYNGEIKLNPSVKLGYIPQEIEFADDKASLVSEFRKMISCTEGEARTILAKYGFLGDHVFKRVSSLSGGEKVLLKLAGLVENEVNFLILDEPTNHVDIHLRERLEAALIDYKGTLLFISHDRYFIHKVATTCFKVENKQLVRSEILF